MWAKKLRVLVSKMVGSSQTLIALRLVRSKLRKREETNNNNNSLAPTRTHQAHQLPQLQTDGAKVSFGQSQLGNGVATLETTAVVAAAVTVTATAPAAVAAAAPTPAIAAATAAAAANQAAACPDSADSMSSELDSGDEEDGKVAPLELFLWSYPNQLSPYTGKNDTLVREIPCEVPQDSKGLRKNLRGKWKRLVKKKPEDSCSIPPELRDQLKQIYVY